MNATANAERDRLYGVIATGGNIASTWCACGHRWINGCAVIDERGWTHTRTICERSK